MRSKFTTSLVIVSLLIIAALCLCGAISQRYSGEAVEISEVCSDWGDILYAADGSGHGFIELYNNSDQPVSLDGWYLSDSTSNWSRYQITECTIDPHSYAVFWSNEEEDVVGLPVEGYFLGFSLQEKETVVLANPSGKVTHSVIIPKLEKSTSYSADDAGLWSVCASSPGSENATGISLASVSVETPTVSLPSGFYEDAISVTMTAAPGCTIYYTLDGTTPDENACAYTEPLVLTDPTSQENRYSMLENVSTYSLTRGLYTPDYAIPKIHVLRAVAMDQQGNISDEVQASYFIDFADRYGFGNTMTLSIITDPDNFFSDELGIYVLGDVWNSDPDMSYDYWDKNAPTNYSVSGKGWRRPVELELFDAQRNLITDQSAGISIHGNWSVVYNQKSFNVYGISETGEETVAFPGVLDSASSSVMLRAGGYRDLYSTKFRDVLNHHLVSDRDIVVQDAIPCQVFLNGEYWGLYNLQERISAGMVATTYDVNENGLIILKNWDAIEGNLEYEQEWLDLENFALENDLSIEENYEYICEEVDIQSFIDYCCFQIYVANYDSFGNNYAVWRTEYAVDDAYGDGRWRWMLYDTDDSLSMIEGFTDPDTDSFKGGHSYINPLDDPLFSSLIQNEAFKLQFAETFVEMAANNFAPEVVNAKIDRYCEDYMAASVVSHHRFLDASYTEQDYLAEVQIIKNFFANRYAYIYDYMVTHLGLEEYGY